MSRNEILEARKLLAHLGWTYQIPMAPNRDGVVLWRGEVPIKSVATKRDMATSTQLADEKLWGDDLDEVDHGALRVSQPYATTWSRGLHPLEWAIHKLADLDARYRVDFDGELPPMPEAEPLGKLPEIVQEIDLLYEQRILLIQRAKDEGTSVEDIARTIGLTKIAVYKILKRDIAGTAPEGDTLPLLSATVQRIEQSTIQRNLLIDEAKGHGANLDTIGRFASLSRAGVHKIISQK